MSNYVQLEIENVALLNDLPVVDTNESDVLTKQQVSDLFSTEAYRIVGANPGSAYYDVYNNIAALSDFFSETHYETMSDVKYLMNLTDGALNTHQTNIENDVSTTEFDISNTTLNITEDNAQMSTDRTNALGDLEYYINNYETLRDGENTRLNNEFDTFFSDLISTRSDLSTELYTNESLLTLNIDNLNNTITNDFTQHNNELQVMGMRYATVSTLAVYSEKSLVAKLSNVSTEDYELYSNVSINLVTEEVRQLGVISSLSTRLYHVDQNEIQEIQSLVDVMSRQQYDTTSRFSDLSTTIALHEEYQIEDLNNMSRDYHNLNNNYTSYSNAMFYGLDNESTRRNDAKNGINYEFTSKTSALLLDLRHKLDIAGGFVTGTNQFKTNNLYLGPFWRVTESSNQLLFQYYNTSSNDWQTVFPFIG
jgi:hypothetical protein